MPDTIIESVLTGKLDIDLLKRWLNNESIEDAPEDCILHCCNVNDFVAYFLSYLRNQTDRILQSNSNAVQIFQNTTPEKLLSRKHHRSISDPTVNDRTDNLSVKSDHSPSRDRKRTGRRVKTKLFSDDKKETTLSSSDDSRLSTSIDRIAISSTPIKNGLKVTDYPNLSLTSPVTPKHYNERCDTPRLTRHSRSHEKSCLGDYLVTATKSTKKKTKKTSIDPEKNDLDFSNSEFPEIGARKSSSLRSDRRRIKPTNIDDSQKSISLNSFTSECFQPLDNTAFKHQLTQAKESTSFETERNILKQERHKLMEKFNILTPQKQTPQIKITQKESLDLQIYVKPDSNKILFKDKIDLLINIYKNLFENNFILSINTEMYFLISILISKQSEDNYLLVESELNNNNMNYLLKSIHNCTYFAVRALWNERALLEVILDKNSLKTLGENKQVRSFYPELAKFLLNTYCLRCESAPVPIQSASRPPMVVCYNIETDNIDNFSGMHAFHNFKKQRDMFYEIYRWYTEGSVAPPSLRSRVRALLSAGSNTHSHLAALVVQHITQTCLIQHTQESKLSKLQRRLTCPTAPESFRLPNFTANEIFYKEFIMYAESDSFRSHLKDTLSTEILILDSTNISIEDRGNSNTATAQEYLQLVKKLCLLAKFLGYSTSLPYTATPVEIISKNNHVVVLNKDDNKIPKEKVLENNITLRNYSQPTIDLKKILQNAINNSRLCITLPWIVHYLSMLDYTSLRLDYYTDIIRTLLKIYKEILKDGNFKKNTLIYLKSLLGWLFDLPNFPIDKQNRFKNIDIDGIDSMEIDESIILELCPCLKDINIMLGTCRLSDRKDGSYRHITPVSLNINIDKVKNKEKELQARLQSELIRSQPSSTRRVLELVTERICSTIVKELLANDLVIAQKKDKKQFTNNLQEFKLSAFEMAKLRAKNRTRDALLALLPNAPEPLHHVAYKAVVDKLTDWMNNHLSRAILCKDITSEATCGGEITGAVGATGAMATTEATGRTVGPTGATEPRGAMGATEALGATGAVAAVSLATHIIHLKEHICLVLDECPPTPLAPLLQAAATLAAAGGLARKPIAQLTIDLCLVYVAKKPHEVTESFLNQLHGVWNTLCPNRKRYEPEELTLPERREGLSPELRNFDDDDRAPTPVSDDEIPVVISDKTSLISCSTSVINNSTSVVNNSTNSINSSTNAINNSTNVINSSTNLINNSTNPINVSTNALNTSINLISTSTNAINSSTNAMNNPTNSINNSTNLTNSSTNSLNASTNLMNSSTNIISSTNPTQKVTKTKNLKPIYNYKSKSIPASPTYLSNSTKNLSNTTKFNSISIPTSPINLTPTYTKTIINKSVSDVVIESDLVLDFFNRVLCPRNIAMMSVSKCNQMLVWEKLAEVLVFLLSNNYLSEDSLTEQCLAVYRQDWAQTILENLSICMKIVSSKWARSSAGKFTLFLEFLAEYCGDMDYEPND